MFHVSSRQSALFLIAVTAVPSMHTVAHGQESRYGVAQQSVMLLCLDFSRDTSMIVAGGDSVRIYDPHTGQLVHRVSPPRLTRAVRFSPIKADLYATAGDDGAIRLWQVSKPEPIHVLKSHSDRIFDLAFSPDGALIASSGTQYAKGKQTVGEFRLWNAVTGELLQSRDLTNHGVNCVAFSENGKLVAFSKNSADGNVASNIEVYDVEQRQLVRSIPFTHGFALSVAFMPDRRNILISGGECVPLSETSCQPTGKLWLAAVDSDQPATLVSTPECDYFRSADFAPKGDQFATGTATDRELADPLGNVVGHSRIAQIQMRRADTGQLLWSEDDEVGDPYGVKVSPDGKFVGCCSGERILILDANSGRRLRSISVDD
jgi:WD40 repeat protein